MTHSLKYLLTASSGVTNFPEFVAVGMVDEVQMGYCDGNITTAEPRQDWMRKLFKEDPELQQLYTDRCTNYRHEFRTHTESFMQDFNQIEGTVSLCLCMNIKCFTFFSPL